MLGIRPSTQHYEEWLRKQLGREIVAADLLRKHKKMRKSAFAFLRATYWRWAETVLAICPELAKAPSVLAVGDIHLENFGTWRDVEGRLIWGVNDFDEAAEMPYMLDLVRLSTSALLARAGQSGIAGDPSRALLAGYREGLAAPAPIVLDREFGWLRDLLEVSEKEREEFWSDIGDLKYRPAPARWRKVLVAAMPDKGVTVRTARRAAGSGSLGRPRWVGVAEWNGGTVVREAKTLAPSAWSRNGNDAGGELRSGDIAGGAFRAPDPWYAVADGIAVRRLSPNNRKIEAKDTALPGLMAKLLHVMGRELAAVHLGVADRRRAILADLDKRDSTWLATSAAAMAGATKADFVAFGGQLDEPGRA